MIKIVHTADLHLSARPEVAEYGLAVFDEIIQVARDEAADFLLISGDLFDTFADAEALRATVRERLDGLESCEVLYLPGNHEELRAGRGELHAFDWGRTQLLHTRPVSLLRRQRGGLTVEFIAIPHAESYDGYRDWDLPARTADLRIALAHGILAGQVYAGPDDEQGGAALDPDLFARNQVDYAALGHVHGHRVLASADTVHAYPGSARVWRAGESGAHGVYILEARGQGSLERPVFRVLKTAGQYRRVVLPLGLDGSAPDPDTLLRDADRADWIEVETTGIVENETLVVELEERIRAAYQDRVRLLQFRRNVEVLPDIAAHPVARRFLENWERSFARLDGYQSPDAEDQRRILLRARELALQEIKNALV